MSDKPKISLTLYERSVLRLIRDAPEPIHAYALRMKLNLAGGTMSPLLRKLSSIKAIEIAEGPPAQKGHPPRICYVITEYGRFLLS